MNHACITKDVENVQNVRSGCVTRSSVKHLSRGELCAVVGDGGRPLGRDADFHVAERLPGRVQ